MGLRGRYFRDSLHRAHGTGGVIRLPGRCGCRKASGDVGAMTTWTGRSGTHVGQRYIYH